MRFARHILRSYSGGFSCSRNCCLAAIAAACLLGACHADADGCFVFRWDKEKDINEPTQKAIILHDKGQEDMVLQVKYEGPAEDFGWLIPVPGLPEVRKGSMECFYELSQLTQRRFGPPDGIGGRGAMSRGMSADEGVTVIKVETIGAYEVAVLSATDPASLAAWLEAHHFAFPKEKQDVLDGYVKKHWYFVAAKIDPTQNGFVLKQGLPKKEPDRATISSSTREKLANGELHPLVISFPSETCVFPLAISAVNGKPSEVSLYVLSSEPLASRVIFDKKFAAYSRERTDWIQHYDERREKIAASMKARDDLNDKRLMEMQEKHARQTNDSGSPAAGRFAQARLSENDPGDPRPTASVMRQLMGTDPVMRMTRQLPDEFYGGGDLVQSMEVGPKDLPVCSKEIRRLDGKTWWLTKDVQVFTPEEMRDLEFEAAVPLLAGKLSTDGGEGPALCLSMLGGCAIPAVLSALKSSNPIERRQAAFVLGGYNSRLGPVVDARVPAVLPELLRDADARIRRDACYAAGVNWEDAFTPRLQELLGDEDAHVRQAALQCLSTHRDVSRGPAYAKLLEEDGLAASEAIRLVGVDNLSREQLVHLFSSTNLPVVSTAFSRLRREDLTLKEIEPLLTNSLVMARMMGLGALTQIGDKEAVTRIVAMLRDSNEAVRWNVRSRLRRLTGQKLGSDPAAYEKWWTENKDNYTPPPPSNSRLGDF
ncbi:MAG TPA: DUF2330 domain-containing protein [Verrucomicrobiae bacterium]|jgi:hypothetical protein|nr:DUF2330 domain-containing protein [Verrucomicrobiae bacterium]